MAACVCGSGGGAVALYNSVCVAAVGVLWRLRTFTRPCSRAQLVVGQMVRAAAAAGRRVAGCGPDVLEFFSCVRKWRIIRTRTARMVQTCATVLVCTSSPSLSPSMALLPCAASQVDTHGFKKRRCLAAIRSAAAEAGVFAVLGRGRAPGGFHRCLEYGKHVALVAAIFAWQRERDIQTDSCASDESLISVAVRGNAAISLAGWHGSERLRLCSEHQHGVGLKVLASQNFYPPYHLPGK
eukprot:351461-Chlamydomonas_euryale.AAC.1